MEINTPLFFLPQHLLDKMNDCMTKQACRLPALTLLGHVIRKQPSWIHKIARYPLLLSLLKCLKVMTLTTTLCSALLIAIHQSPLMLLTNPSLNLFGGY